MRRIVYLMSGKAHLPYLVVSLRTLRQHWQGSIDIYAWDGHDSDSYRIASRIEKDDRLDVCVFRRKTEYRGKNAQFIDKIKLVSSRHFDDVILYLDADTSVHGNLDVLFDEAERTGFCCTQFCGWVTTGSIPRNRVKRLKDFGEIDQRSIDTAMTRPWPSPNGGVFAARPNSQVLTRWFEWTWTARKVFIADEAVLHLLPIVFGPDQVSVLTGGIYNCSTFPKWLPKELNGQEVRIWHYHGDSNVRPQKSQVGHQRWKKMYDQCMKDNIGGMREWIREAVIANKHMNRARNEWLANC